MNDTPIYEWEDAINFIAERCNIDKDTIETVLTLEEDYMKSIGIIMEEQSNFEIDGQQRFHWKIGVNNMINVQWKENGEIQYENFLNESSVNDFVADLKKRECVDIEVTKDIEKVTAERIRKYNSGIEGMR